MTEVAKVGAQVQGYAEHVASAKTTVVQRGDANVQKVGAAVVAGGSRLMAVTACVYSLPAGVCDMRFIRG